MAASLNGRKVVLCAHDDPAVLLELRRALHGAGYLPIATGSGFDAVRLALQEYPDLLLLDVSLRDLDGYAVRRAVAKLLHCEPPPAVFLNDGTDEDALRSFFAGAAGCTGRPFTPQTVLEAVRQAFLPPRAFP